MKFLFDLQISSFDENGTALIRSDSNWIFTQGIIAGLEELGFDCQILNSEYHGTIIDRYFMDYAFLSQKINLIEFDILWTNDPCKVVAYRQLTDKPIICYNHWIVDRESPFFFRQIEGFLNSDVALFNSQFGLDRFRSICRPFISNVNISNVKQPRNGYVNPPLISSYFINAINRISHYPIPTVLFNHRLSSAPQYKANVDSFIDLLDCLDKTGEDYVALVSNPSGKQHPILERPKVENIYSSDYYEYIAKAARAHVQVNFFDYPGQWSMSMAEATCLGLKVVSERDYGYLEVLEGYHNTLDDFFIPDVARCILDKPERKKIDAIKQIQRLSPTNVVATQLLPLLKGLI